MRILTLILFSLLLPTAAAEEEDPFAAIDALLEDNFEEIDRTLEEQYQLLDQALESAYDRLGQEVEKEWGPGEGKLPSQSEWVDYSDDKQTRRTIDFENGVLKLERLVSNTDGIDAVINDLNTAGTALVTDSVADLGKRDLALDYAREELSGQGIELSRPVTTDRTPVLEVVGATFAPEVVTPLLKAAVAKPQQPATSLSAGQSLRATLTPLPNQKQKLTLEISLKGEYNFELANQYFAEITAEAERQSLPPSLLLAVMETESSFNPRARSPVPAFGLMQLVPRSGAMDAYEYVYGEKTLVDPEYLYQPDNNVELGAAYLNILHNRYLRHITDSESRQLCAIAAYNTGAGNVARSFVGTNNVRTAAPVINAMTPEQVFIHLQEKLPYEETRRYIVKVTKAKKKYEAYDSLTAGRSAP